MNPLQGSKSFRDLNPHIFGTQKRAPVDDEPAKGSEDDLQRKAEQELDQMGYKRLTAMHAVLHASLTTPQVGWYAHMAHAVGNPFLPDLVVFDLFMRRCVGIELKVRSVYQKGQREMIELGAWQEARTVERVVEIVKDFEAAT